MGAITEIHVPDIGDFKDVEVIEILVKPGESVTAEQSLISVESDKATMEIPSPQAGRVSALRVKTGDKVSEGSLILLLEADAPAAGAPAPAATEAPAAPAAPTTAPVASAAAPAAAPAPAPAAAAPGRAAAVPHASPSVRKFARELGVDLGAVTGTGPKGRILQSDVQQYVKSALQGGAAGAAAASGGVAGLSLLPWPKVDFARFGPIEVQPLSRIRKLSGANLARNWVMIPHVTNHEEADITDLEAFRVQVNRENNPSGVKLTLLAFLVRACVAALQRYPEFNASLDGDNLVLKRYYHIGFAADTPNGLVVPVIRDADRKGILEIARETSALAARAREGKLSPAEMQGGTFSISSLGGIGGTSFTPIVNAPEVAILGVSKSAMKPVWDGKAFVPRLILPLSLSYDHRVIDGAAGARFNAFLAQALADMRRTLL
jgi:pyruvate dehydrogenase E2 component (dihydrolipoamide acetyltransferase)